MFINGKEYLPAQFLNGGHVEVITAGTGEQLPRFFAMIADAMADVSRARQATSADSHNAGLTGTQIWELDEDVSFAPGSAVTIARTSDPTGVRYLARVEDYVSETKLLTVSIIDGVGAGGPYTDWTIAVAGDKGDAGADGTVYTAGEGLGLSGSTLYALQHGRCRLAKSGSNLVLSRFNGKHLLINGVPQAIPSTGVSLAATGLTAGTTYYIYAYMSSGTMTLEASTTGHATDSATGVEIKTGDATRTLVGMARPVTGPAWQDTAAQRFVASWFNRVPVRAESAITANRTRSGAMAEINTELRAEFLTWAGDIPAQLQGSAANATGSNNGVYTALYLDAAATMVGSSIFNSDTANAYQNVGCGGACGVTEGYHYVSGHGGSDSGTVTYFGSSDTGRVRVSAMLSI